jgi:hypothetical protein
MTPYRYLTKLCDQIVCLISDEHSEQLVWQDDEPKSLHVDMDYQDSDIYDQMFTFSVQQTKEEDTVTVSEGFSVRLK